MFRLLFVMVTTVLIGLGSGYFLWGTRVARLTEALSGLTLELDTMRARLANPPASQADTGGVKIADELRVINESMAAFRQEMAEQKVLVEKAAGNAGAAGNVSPAELSSVKSDLAACIADKLDLQSRCGNAAAAAPEPVAPAYRPPVAPSAPVAPALPPTYRPYAPR